MKHSDLKVGMKVKRVSNFEEYFFTSSKDTVSTVAKIIHYPFFLTEEDKLETWNAEYFEPVEESLFVEGGYTKDFGSTEIAAICVDIKQTKEETKMNKIDINKKYRTRCGYPVRILCVDRGGSHPVVAIVGITNAVYCYNDMGQALLSTSEYDLIEVSPWEDFKKDDKVMVRDGAWDTWAPRYFSHVEDGKPYTFINGRTSFSNEGEVTTYWNYCRKPTEEELGE